MHHGKFNHDCFSLHLQNELELAVSFYLTTLALQSTFEPARDRLIAISCKNSDIMKNLERKRNNDAQKWNSIL